VLIGAVVFKNILFGRYLTKKIDWFSLQDGDYISLLPNQQGVICSLVFPGLWLDVEFMLNGNMPQVLGTLQAGINSAEHQEFVEKLIAPQSGEE
jgi:hypothetical protein